MLCSYYRRGSRHLVGRHLELVLHVDGRRRQEGVHARPLRQAHCLPRHLQVPAGAPGSHAQLTPLTPGSRACLSPAGAAAHPFHMRTPKLRSVCICLALCRPAVAGMLPPLPVSEGGRAPGRPPCCVVPGLPYYWCSMRYCSSLPHCTLPHCLRSCECCVRHCLRPHLMTVLDRPQMTGT